MLPTSDGTIDALASILKLIRCGCQPDQTSNGGGLWICMFWQLPCTIFLIVVQTKLFAVNLSQHEVIENDEDDKEYEYEANDSA